MFRRKGEIDVRLAWLWMTNAFSVWRASLQIGLLINQIQTIEESLLTLYVLSLWQIL